MHTYIFSGKEDECELFHEDFETFMQAVIQARNKFFIHGWNEIQRGRIWGITRGNRHYKIERRTVKRDEPKH